MLTIILVINLVMYLLLGIRIIRPTERGLRETLGRYSGFCFPGFHFVFVPIQRIYRLETTERMVQVAPQEIITEDNLNAVVDLIVYFQVKKDEDSMKKAIYEVSDFESQIVSLAQTTSRNVIGGMKFKDVNSQRNTLNVSLANILGKETEKWGVEVVRVELKEITPPENVQQGMNQVIVAENAKRSAVDFATAKETEADGVKRALIKGAEGKKQAAILEAEGQAQAFELVNKSFTGNSQLLRQLEVTEKSLKDNAKVIITERGISPQIILGDLPIIKK